MPLLNESEMIRVLFLLLKQMHRPSCGYCFILQSLTHSRQGVPGTMRGTPLLQPCKGSACNCTRLQRGMSKRSVLRFGCSAGEQGSYASRGPKSVFCKIKGAHAHFVWCVKEPGSGVRRRV